MTNIRLKVLAIAVATTFAAGAALAQTSASPQSTSPQSTSPGSSANPGVTPGAATTAPGATGSPSAPSATGLPGSPLGGGAEANISSEERARCAALSGTAQADCLAEARRSGDDRLRMGRDTTSPSPTRTR